MRTRDVADATAPFAQYAREVGNEPMILTSTGTPIAALVPIDGADLETISLSTNPTFLALIERSRARLTAEGAVSSEEMRRLASSLPPRAKRGVSRYDGR